MKIHKIFLLALACTWSLGAAAEWQWLDNDGRKVFSDRAPPNDVPQARILKQPSGQPAAKALPTAETGDGDGDGAEAVPAAAAPTPAAPSGTDKALAAKKAEAEAAEAAKEKAAEAKRAAARADNCTRAQRAKTTLESNRPIRQTNAQGNDVILSADDRAAELRRIQDIINSDCKR